MHTPIYTVTYPTCFKAAIAPYLHSGLELIRCQRQLVATVPNAFACLPKHLSVNFPIFSTYIVACVLFKFTEIASLPQSPHSRPACTVLLFLGHSFLQQHCHTHYIFCSHIYRHKLTSHRTILLLVVFVSWLDSPLVQQQMLYFH